MEQFQKELADMIFEREAFKFGEFKLKLHEKNPGAPLSPFYLDLRGADNPTGPGPLTVKDYDLIAEALWTNILANDLDFRAIVGIPYAGDPIAAAVKRIVPEPRGFRLIKLSKKMVENKRKIAVCPGFDYHQGENVLVIDDIVTKADSKIEAIKAIESEGSVVRYLAVLIDRQQGGGEQLRKAGYNLISCFTVRDLLDYYKIKGKIDSRKYLESIVYIGNN